MVLRLSLLVILLTGMGERGATKRTKQRTCYAQVLSLFSSLRSFTLQLDKMFCWTVVSKYAEGSVITLKLRCPKVYTKYLNFRSMFKRRRDSSLNCRNRLLFLCFCYTIKLFNLQLCFIVMFEVFEYTNNIVFIYNGL